MHAQAYTHIPLFLIQPAMRSMPTCATRARLFAGTTHLKYGGIHLWSVLLEPSNIIFQPAAARRTRASALQTPLKKGSRTRTVLACTRAAILGKATSIRGLLCFYKATTAVMFKVGPTSKTGRTGQFLPCCTPSLPSSLSLSLSVPPPLLSCWGRCDRIHWFERMNRLLTVLALHLPQARDQRRACTDTTSSISSFSKIPLWSIYKSRYSSIPRLTPVCDPIVDVEGLCVQVNKPVSSPCSVPGEDGRDALHNSGHVGVWVSLAEKREDMLHLVNRDEKGLSTAVATVVAGCTSARWRRS